MITFEKANEVVSMWIEETSKGKCEICSIDDKPYGWVFYYLGKDFDPTKLGTYVGGNAPVIFDRITGEIIVTGTARETEYYIGQYEATLDKESLALQPEPSGFIDKYSD